MHDVIIEKTILYYLIFKEEELELSEEDFVSERNVQIFKAVKELKANKKEVNVISIKNKINKNNLEILKYLSDLSEFEYGTNLEFAYKTLKELTKKRKMKEIASKIDKQVEDELDISSFIETQIKNMNEINKDIDKQVTLKDSVYETVKILEEKYKNSYNYDYFTGIFDLDEVTNGLHEDELTVIGARPGVGKSTFALHIAEKIASRNILVGYVSLEMSKTQIIQKLISKMSRIDSKKIRNGTISEEEFPKIVESSDKIAKLKLDITTETRSIQDIEIYAKRKKNKENLGLLIIDYLQLITNKEKSNTREQEVASITRALKLLSLELHIPIIALSQLRRDGGSSKPTLADLRESGAIEQDADNVVFLYRDNDNEEQKTVEDITIDLQKQRVGGLVTTKIRFDKKISTFSNLIIKK